MQDLSKNPKAMVIMKKYDLIEDEYKALVAKIMFVSELFHRNPARFKNPYELFASTKTGLLELYREVPQESSFRNFLYFGPQEFVEILKSLDQRPKEWDEIYLRIKENVEQLILQIPTLSEDNLRESQFFEKNRAHYSDMIREIFDW